MRRDEIRKICDEMIANRHTDDFVAQAGVGLALAAIAHELLDELERAEAERTTLLETCHGGRHAAPHAMAGNLEMLAGLLDQGDVTDGETIGKTLWPGVLRCYAENLRLAIAGLDAPAPRVEEGT